MKSFSKFINIIQITQVSVKCGSKCVRMHISYFIHSNKCKLASNECMNLCIFSVYYMCIRMYAHAYKH